MVETVWLGNRLFVGGCSSEQGLSGDVEIQKTEFKIYYRKENILISYKERSLDLELPSVS